MGSCVSKKAARSGTGAKVALPLPPEKDTALPPVVVEEEEVKEVLSEMSVLRPRLWEPEGKVRSRQEHEEHEIPDSVSAGSFEAEKPIVKAGSEQEMEKRVVDAPVNGRARSRSPDQRKPRDAGDWRARSPSPASAKRRQGAGGGEHVAAARPRREQPAVVSGIGCRSGRFSPSAARRAAESSVKRTYSAREADMMLPTSRTSAKRSLNGDAYAGSGIRRDPGERSGRRPDSPTARRPPASPAANGTISRQASVGAARKAPNEDTNHEQTKQRCGIRGDLGEVRDELDQPALPRRGYKAAAEGAFDQNPSVAMECFIFL